MGISERWEALVIRNFLSRNKMRLIKKSEKIKLIITGGLGNQMFEYAFLLALRNKGHKVEMDTSYYDYIKMHNGYELERVFNVKESLFNRQGLHIFWLRYLNKYRPQSLYLADDLTYNPLYLDKPSRYLWGYWQDERYFKDIENDVRIAFKFRNIDDFNKAIAQEMSNKCSVSLHVRRGDYTEFGMNLIGDDYYSEAIKYIRNSVVEMPFFYIFSDDAEIAKGIADKMGIKYSLITHNRDSDSYKDMYLMSHCKHNIIANSSFSWWGAWLNENTGKIVIAPRIWNEKCENIQPQVEGWMLF